jgi:hypothetical protein
VCNLYVEFLLVDGGKGFSLCTKSLYYFFEGCVFTKI